MARKGRPYLGKPFRQKKDGVEYGTWNVYDPIAKKRLNLETEDLNEATAKVQNLFGDLIGQPNPKAVKSVATEPRLEKSATTVNLPSDSSTEASDDIDITVDASAALNAWADLGSKGQQQLPLDLEDPPTQAQAPQREATVTPIASARKSKNSSGFSDADIKTLTTGMHKIVASANVAMLDFTVRQLGVVPMMPSEDEMEMLATGWELQLKEIFKDIEMKPYMLIIAANALIGMAMYTRGEKIPQKPKPQVQS